MDNIKFLFPLNCEIAIFVPSTVDVDKEIDNSQYVKTTLAKLSSIFGGATAQTAYGGWVAESGNLVTEKVTIVYANCTSEQLENNIAECVDYAKQLCKKMSQECISVRVNGKLGFIS